MSNLQSKRSNNFKDLSGTEVGWWNVLSLAFIKGKTPVWNCKCRCGVEKQVSSNSLRSAKVNSCGKCGSRKGQRTNHEISHELMLAAKNVMARYKCQAIDRNLTFNLEYEQFWTIIQGNCFYCDKPPTSFQHGKRGDKLMYNGVDRVDNDRGYEPDNVVTCCKSCNSKKKATNKDMIFKAYQFLFPGGS